MAERQQVGEGAAMAWACQLEWQMERRDTVHQEARMVLCLSKLGSPATDEALKSGLHDQVLVAQSQELR